MLQIIEILNASALSDCFSIKKTYQSIIYFESLDLCSFTFTTNHSIIVCDSMCLCGTLEAVRLTTVYHKLQSKNSIVNVLKRYLVEVIWSYNTFPFTFPVSVLCGTFLKHCTFIFQWSSQKQVYKKVNFK